LDVVEPLILGPEKIVSVFDSELFKYPDKPKPEGKPEGDADSTLNPENKGNSHDSSKVIVYRHVLPAEPCELCGQLAVEWEIQMPDGKMLRRCNSCFNKMRKEHVNITWKNAEDSA
jgi:hypothetical protein